jgi:putative endonuclease
MTPGWRNLPAGRLVDARECRFKECDFYMFYVYAIKSISRNYIYVGMTNNLERRMKEHNGGENRTTKPYRPFVQILTEEFNSREEARKREKYLKSGIGKEYLKTLLI